MHELERCMFGRKNEPLIVRLLVEEESLAALIDLI